MNIKEQLDQDLKTAMLSGDKHTVTVIRGLKSAVLYAEVAQGSRQEGLKDPEVIEILGKEAKKRQESADLYAQGGNQVQADVELAEKAIVQRYLPAQLNDEELKAIIDTVVADTGAEGAQAMGQVIGAVKQQTAGQAEGSRIATLVKERLTS